MQEYVDPNSYALEEQGWKARNTISAREATAYITIKGQNHLLFYAKKVEAKFKKNKVEIRAMGRRSVGHKTTSWTGSGTLVIYEVTSMFKQMFLNYASSGRDTFFSIKITNEDPSTGFGRETKILTECNLDEMTIAMMDTEDKVLEQEIPFTFEGVEMLEAFRTIPKEEINEDNNE